MNEILRDTPGSEKSGASYNEPATGPGVAQTQTATSSGQQDLGAESKASSERVKEHVRAQTRQGKEQADEQARRIAQEAREHGWRLVEEQKRNAARQVDNFATALHSSAHELGERQHSTASGYVNWAASNLDNLADSLRTRDVGSLWSDVEGLAKRQPALFFGGAVAAGLLLSRFLKSSSERYAEDYDYPSEEDYAAEDDYLLEGEDYLAEGDYAHQYYGPETKPYPEAESRPTGPQSSTEAARAGRIWFQFGTLGARQSLTDSPGDHRARLADDVR